ncbi:histidinol-phosphate transaminase [Siphonobacter sp. SORGH_AS_1065]|uniref:histidinol-phosphate transaminase n=1 Tax=Siphonobacter sp. SORGH_AS_1065 TaxID=3041795 RepID=UPI002787DDB5|nr:histidinol-phosphate transaminase [Siphonobacter sp. SORGH_AS_1065]MDQ1089343.1 histidinol-phosphate aminotransferase [Siphonobacter sp. SORGH_AS_1065]
MFILEKLIRPHLLALTPYSSARDEYSGKEGVFLDANENPLGSSTNENFNRYPDPYQWAVKEKLAPIKGVRTSQILLGNGSDEPIDLLVRAFAEPKEDHILILPPTYGMYEVSANIQNVAVKKVPLTTDFQIDVDAVLAAVEEHTKIIWLCSPNNPSGNLLRREDILRIIEGTSCIVVVDEAYIDFAADATMVPLLNQYPNLVVLQTFSKAWGLAGLRVGMCFASEAIIALLNKIKSPYNISSMTQRLLLEALDHVEKKNEMVEVIAVNRTRLRERLEALPNVEHVFPTDSNQLLVKFQDSAAVFSYLLEHKIIVRDRSKVKHCDNCLRISVGTQEEDDVLMQSLQQFARELVHS